jgi:hypothetical protein
VLLLGEIHKNQGCLLSRVLVVSTLGPQFGQEILQVLALYRICSGSLQGYATKSEEENKMENDLWGNKGMGGDRGSTVVKVLCYKSEGR